MKTFRPLILSSDDKICDENKNKYIDIAQSATNIHYIISYLAEKYGTRITRLVKDYDRNNFLNPIFLETPPATTRILAEDFYIFNRYLSKIRQQQDDYREAFIFGNKHSVLLVYVKEDNEEYLLLLDSLTSSNFNSKKISELTGIKTYKTVYSRQADGYSCVVDAIVLGREITQKIPATGKYKILKIMHEIILDHSTSTILKLPDELLITAQNLDFVTTMRHVDKKKKIHKDLTLDKFREKYTDNEIELRSHLSDKIQKYTISNYLRKKSFKFAVIAEIEFYLQQIQEKLLRKLTALERNQFVIQAKASFQQQSNLNALAMRFLLELKPSIVTKVVSEQPIEGLSLKEIAKKYNVLIEQMEAMLKDMEASKTNFFEKIYKINNKPLLLAFTQYILELTAKDKKYFKYLKSLAVISLDHADMIVDDNRLRKRILNFYLIENIDNDRQDTIFQLAAANAYIAKRFVERYSDILSVEMIEALTFIAENDPISGYQFMVDNFESVEFLVIPHKIIVLYATKENDDSNTINIFYALSHPSWRYRKIMPTDLPECFYHEIKQAVTSHQSLSMLKLTVNCREAFLDYLCKKGDILQHLRLYPQLKEKEKAFLGNSTFKLTQTFFSSHGLKSKTTQNSCFNHQGDVSRGVRDLKSKPNLC